MRIHSVDTVPSLTVISEMVGGLDEALSEARLLHQEIIRYDAKLKLRIHELP